MKDMTTQLKEATNRSIRIGNLFNSLHKKGLINENGNSINGKIVNVHKFVNSQFDNPKNEYTLNILKDGELDNRIRIGIDSSGKINGIHMLNGKGEDYAQISVHPNGYSGTTNNEYVTAHIPGGFELKNLNESKFRNQGQLYLDLLKNSNWNLLEFVKDIKHKN